MTDINYVLKEIDDLDLVLATPFADGRFPIHTGGQAKALYLGQLKADLITDTLLLGIPTTATPNLGDSSNRLATTKFVQDKLTGLSLNPATANSSGTVKTNSSDANPVVYLKGEVDNLLAQTIPLVKGGTGAIDAAGARANLGAAKSGSNADITALTALNAVPSVVSTAISTAATNAASPVGTILAYAGANAPPGYLTCNGGAVSRAAFPALFAVIGLTYGAGDQTGDTFSLPNLNGRVPMGAGISAQSGANRGVGATGGAETHTLAAAEMPSHNHSAQTDWQGSHAHAGSFTDAQGSHQHTFALRKNATGVGQQNPVASNASGSSDAYSTDPSGVHSHSVYLLADGGHAHNLITSAAGGSAAHNNLQPYVVLNFIIKAA